MANIEKDVDISSYRNDFQILKKKVHNTSLVYFDNAATTLKPDSVIEAELNYYRETCANVHRGVHSLSESATTLFEEAREQVRSFINAKTADEVIFTSGTTMSINTIVLGWAKHHLKENDEILLTEMEHHANIVPWHLMQKDIGVKLKFVPVNPDGTLDLQELPRLVGKRTKLASFTMVSNALGSVNPVEKMIALLKELNPEIDIVLDAAQAIAHSKIDVRALGCSALAFSGHKLFGPTGTGVLYLHEKFRDMFSPVFGGGDMIKTVELCGSSYADFPAKLEAGTPNIAGVIGLGAAICYVNSIGIEKIKEHEHKLCNHFLKAVQEVEGFQLVGKAADRIPVFSFALANAHPHDIASILDRYGIAVRSGHHCAEPLMRALKVTATARASLSFYNTTEEIDWFVACLHRARNLLI